MAWHCLPKETFQGRGRWLGSTFPCCWQIPKECLGSKWSCHSFPFLGHLPQSLAEGPLLVLRAPDVEVFQLLVSQDESPTWMHVREVVAAHFAGTRLSLGHRDPSMSSPGAHFSLVLLLEHLGFSCLLLEGWDCHVLVFSCCQQCLLCASSPFWGFTVCIYPFSALLSMLSSIELHDPRFPPLEH